MGDQEKFPNRTASMVVGKAGGTPVVVRALDHCLDDWGVSCVDLLKIDVDGFETKIIEGAARSLASGRIRRVIIELNEHWLRRTGSSKEHVRARFAQHGFAEVTETLPGWLLGPGEDVLFVRRDR